MRISPSSSSSILDRYLSNLSVEVDPFALCLIDPGWRLTLPGPPCTMLHFVVKGDGWLDGPHGTHEHIGRNWVVVVPAGVAHSLETREDYAQELKIDRTPSGPPVHYIHAGEKGPAELVVGCGTLNVRYGDAIGLFDHLDDLLLVDLSGIPEVPGLFHALIEEQSRDAPGTPVLQGAIMTQVLIHMLRTLAARSDASLAWLRALDDPRLASAIDRILEDPFAPHSVESLAATANMSRSAFAGNFQKAFKNSPMHLVNHVRLERAARMLAGSSMPVQRIADRCGFSSRSHFSNAFKKHMGLSPVAFREQAGAG